MTNPEGNGFDNFDPRDFGEPTPETRERFGRALDRLQQIASRVRVYEIDEIVGDVDTVGRFGLSRDDLCPLTMYSYDQKTDPLFGLNEETHLSFTLTDGDPKKIKNWHKILGPSPVHNIYYEGIDADITYDAGFDDEMLYVTAPRDRDIGLYSEEFLPMMIERVKNHLDAVHVGASNPTEGSVKKLIAVIDEEVTKRVLGY